MAVAQDLLDILRCPYCVSGATRKAGDDPGRLELVRGNWLVCQEPDCGRKYPIKEDIPVMLIDEGDQWIDTPVEALPEPGPLVEPAAFSFSSASVSAGPSGAGGFDRNRMVLILLGLLAVALLVGGLIWFFRDERRQA